MRIIHYNTREIADSIATHDNGKHYEEEKHKWIKIGVVKDAFPSHVYETISSKDSKVYQGNDLRDIYYNRKTLMIVVVNPGGRDHGTAFFCGSEKRFKKMIKKEKKRSNDLGITPSKTHTKGGISALSDTKRIRREKSMFKDNLKQIVAKSEMSENRKVKREKLHQIKTKQAKLKTEEKKKTSDLERHRAMIREQNFKKDQIKKESSLERERNIIQQQKREDEVARQRRLAKEAEERKRLEKEKKL